MRFFPSFGYCKECCSERRGADTFSSKCISFLWINTKKFTCWITCYFSLRNFHTVFLSCCTNFHSYQQYIRVPLSLHSPEQFFFLVFLLIAILIGVMWYLIVVLICISLISDVDHPLFTCWPFICLFWKNIKGILFKSFVHFKLYYLFWWWYWAVWIIYIFLILTL